MGDECIIDYRSQDGTFRFDVRERADHLVLNQAGDMTAGDARQLSAALTETRRKLGRRYVLVMPLPAEFRSVEPEARKIMADTVLGDDSPLVKLSIFGGSFFMRMMFNMYGRVSRIPLRLFATQAEAEDWARTQG